MSDSDSLGGSASDVSGGTPPTSARRASGRRRRFQVIGVLAVVAIGATVIVGITTSGSRSGTLATDYANATLTCVKKGTTELTLPLKPTAEFYVSWTAQGADTVGDIISPSGSTMSIDTPQLASSDPKSGVNVSATNVTVTQTVGTDTWSISAACS
ncbi:unannotated protein [freshwater metagenome]|uniref:Unannotated protein n=1 Tax=freshwater metagenome TaxID=449393 RepID=A0A6J7RBM1_9ZZZZ